jgi:tetratricopeptide (TPR) repeat protein
LRRIIKTTVFFIFLFITISYSQTNGSLLHLADADFFALEYEKSIELYKEYLNTHPNDYEVLWKLARVFVNYGEVPGNEKKEYFEYAKAYAEKSIMLNPNCSDAHTFLAAAIGNLAFWGDNKLKIEYSWKMMELLNKAVKINNNDHIALSILGSLERMLSGISWLEKTLANVIYGSSLPKGSYTNAINYFNRAISIDPTLIRHHYELGLVYKEMGEKLKAKEQFHIAQKCPIQLKADYRRLELINKYLKEIE